MIKLIAAFVFALMFVASANSQELTIKEQTILKNVLAYHKNNLECDDRGSEMESSEFIRFKKKSEYDSDTIVVLISCSFHANQVTWVAYSVFDDGDPEISILSFTSTNDGNQWIASKF